MCQQLLKSFLTKQVVRTTFKTRKSKDSRPDEENEELVDHDHELVALQENSRPIIKSNIDLNQPDEAEAGSLDSQIGKLVSDLMDVGHYLIADHQEKYCGENSTFYRL